MEIKPAIRQPSGGSARHVRSSVAFRLLAWLLVGSIGVLATSIVIVQLLAPAAIRNAVRRAAVEAGYGFHEQDATPLDALWKLPGRLADSVLNRAAIPNLVIDIGFRNLSELNAKRAEALRLGYLVQGEDDFVPASIRTDDRTISVRLRLKGDMADHLRTDKWSFRIHTRGDDHVFGLRRFSIQHPMTRGFQGEVLFFETLRRLGVLAPRYFFADVIVNGNRLGLMAVEEHFSKELLEHNSRLDGVIIRFDESLMWADRVVRGRLAVNDRGPFDNYLNAPITAFRSSRILESEPLQRQHEVAAGMLRAFAEGEISAAEVFDVQALGRFLAAAELWGAWHAVGWNNQRFYFNPLTMKLEPIGYDADLNGGIDPNSINSPGTLVRRMLEDPEVYAVFEATLAALKQEIESGELIQHLESVQAKALKELRTEYFFLESIDLAQLQARARALPFPAVENEQHEPYAVYVLATVIREGDRAYLELLNPLPHEVEIVSIDRAGPAGTVAEFEPLQPVSYPLRLEPMEPNGKREAVRIEFTPSTFHADFRLEVKSRIRDEAQIMTATAMAGVPAVRENPIPNADLEELLRQYPFLSVSEAGDQLELGPGHWRFNGSLVVPKGLGLTIAHGATLQFGPDAGIVVYGPVVMKGTEDRPISLEPWPEADLWQGIVVHGSEQRSEWSHVTVRNTAGVRWSSWALTGGTTFYRSDVTLSSSTFSGNRAEDALNVIHSRFELEGVDFVDTASDGFDSDFSVGSIRGGSFVNIGVSTGADGLDISGSDVTLLGTRFTNVSDKAVSVGEGSKLLARDLLIDRCVVAAASKDGSTLLISDSTVSHATLAGLMSYTKKLEYGAASLLAENVSILETPTPTWVQHGSSLELNGRSIETEEIDVDALYETYMRKANLL